MLDVDPAKSPSTMDLPAGPSHGLSRRPDLIDFLLDADLDRAGPLVEAGELYGEDADRELADLEAGRHPAQRSSRR